MQNASDMSFKLGITRESDASMEHVKTSFQKSGVLNDSNSKSLKTSNRTGLTNHNMGSGLLIQESDDDDSDGPDLRVGEDKIVESDCSRDANKAKGAGTEIDGRNFSLKADQTVGSGNSKCEKSAYLMSLELRESEIDSRNLKEEQPDKKSGPPGLLIQESDEEETDASDNESDRFQVNKSCFFSPETLRKTYGGKLDVVIETDKSDAEGLFSPGVVGRAIAKSDEISAGDNKYDETGNSQDYMLVATQAYGVVDSDDSETDVECSLGFEHGANDAKVEKETLLDSNANVSDLNISENFVDNSRKGLPQKTAASASENAGSTEPAVNRGSSNMEASSSTSFKSETYLSDQDCDTVKLSDSDPSNFKLPSRLSWHEEQEGATMPVGEFNAINQDSDALQTPESQKRAENSVSYPTEQEAKTIGLDDFDHKGNDHKGDTTDGDFHFRENDQECATMLLTDTEQECKTIALQESSIQGGTMGREEVETEFLYREEQEARTVALDEPDNVEERTNSPSQRHRGPTDMTALTSSEQEASTIPIRDLIDVADSTSITTEDSKINEYKYTSFAENKKVGFEKRNKGAKSEKSPVSDKDENSSTIKETMETGSFAAVKVVRFLFLYCKICHFDECKHYEDQG